MKSIWLAVCLTVAVAFSALAAPPSLLRSDPPHQARDVPTDYGVIRLWFDQNMKENGWTFWQSDQGELPPLASSDSSPWVNARYAELKIGPLKPGITYAIQLNSARKEGFRSAERNEPLPITTLVFTTAGARVDAPIQPKDLDTALRVPSGSPTPAPPPPSPTWSPSPPASTPPVPFPPPSPPASRVTPSAQVTIQDIAGTWLMRNQQMEMRVDFNPDGRFTRVTRTAQETETIHGSCRISQGIMEVRVDQDDEVLHLTVRMPDSNTLELWEDAENWIQFIRQGAAPAPRGAPYGPQTSPQLLPGQPGSVIPAPPPGSSGQSRPPCPSGWSEFNHPMVGMQAHVPPNYWVRLHGGVMLTVEEQFNPATAAFMITFRPRAGAAAAELADSFARFVAQTEPRLKATVLGQPSRDRAVSQFTSVVSGQPVEGKYCTIVGTGGSQAFVIGVMAPRGQLQRELPTLQRIAQGFGFALPRGRWVDYQSPAGGFTMKIPDGWQVQSSDGLNPKDNIDWVTYHPNRPLSRAFQWCPKYCTPDLARHPNYQIQGYQTAVFQSAEQCATTSLGQICPGARLTRMQPNERLTTIFRQLMQDVGRFLSAMNAGNLDVTVYDCLAEGQLEGRPITIAFVTGISTLLLEQGIMGRAVDTSVTLRGWCAPSDEFIQESPVLERIFSSMQLTPAFVNRVVRGNEYAGRKIRETYDTMNRIDDQIRQSRWDTQDAIAEMNYDNLRDYGGYVNEKTGRIEQIPPDGLVKNSSGQLVSREEVERGVPADQATVLRGAFSNDYMQGIYGRIEFNP